MYQCFLYMRDPNNPLNLDSNHYAFPLTISPVVDTVKWKVIRIDLLPSGSDHSIKEPRPLKIQPPNEYDPAYQQLRTDLKPLNVVQPEGASFKITQVGDTGRVVEWQKWFFRVGFNQREGVVLHDVCVSLDEVCYCLYTDMPRSAMTTGASSIGCRCQTW